MSTTHPECGNLSDKSGSADLILRQQPDQDDDEDEEDDGKDSDVDDNDDGENDGGYSE
jgi:hypothetical protein